MLAIFMECFDLRQDLKKKMPHPQTANTPTLMTRARQLKKPSDANTSVEV